MSGFDETAEDGWEWIGGRLMRACVCAWEQDTDANTPWLVPGETIHTRERIEGAPVEICYHADDDRQVVTVLAIRTIPAEKPEVP